MQPTHILLLAITCGTVMVWGSGSRGNMRRSTLQAGPLQPIYRAQLSPEAQKLVAPVEDKDFHRKPSDSPAGSPGRALRPAGRSFIPPSSPDGSISSASSGRSSPASSDDRSHTKPRRLASMRLQAAREACAITDRSAHENSKSIPLLQDPYIQEHAYFGVMDECREHKAQDIIPRLTAHISNQPKHIGVYTTPLYNRTPIVIIKGAFLSQHGHDPLKKVLNANQNLQYYAYIPSDETPTSINDTITVLTYAALAEIQWAQLKAAVATPRLTS